MKSIENYIYEDKYIGRGTFSKVYTGYSKTNPDKKYAIKKIYRKDDPKYSKYIDLEINIMSKLNHKNIIKLYNTFFTDKHIFLILELCDTDLYTYINNNTISENDTQYIVKQIVDAIKYIMDNNIVHRDLKPHNILINKSTKEIKICDFGFAREFKDTLLSDTVCGSPLYMAPELLKNQKYNIKSDIWSLGIIMYEIVMKNHPFKSDNINDLINKINNDKPIINNSTFSTECKELIHNLLIVDYNKRLDWDDIFNHKWLNNKLNTKISSTLNNDLILDNSNISHSSDMCFEDLYDIEETEYIDSDEIRHIKDEELKYNENNKSTNYECDYIFVNKPVNKSLLNKIMDNSNEFLNKIKKFI